MCGIACPLDPSQGRQVLAVPVLLEVAPLRTVQPTMGSKSRPMAVADAVEDSSPALGADGGTETIGTVRDGIDGRPWLVRSHRECTSAVCRMRRRVESQQQRVPEPCPLRSHFPDGGKRIRWLRYSTRRPMLPCW